VTVFITGATGYIGARVARAFQGARRPPAFYVPLNTDPSSPTSSSIASPNRLIPSAI
jgi:nucleoside-diphosphate-sugar epimerase